MRIKWHFRNEITEDFSTTPMFRPKSNWTPRVGHPNLEMFLSELEKKFFEDSNFSHFHRQNFSRKEWKALWDLAEDRNIVIKSADKGSCVVIWDRAAMLRKLIDNLVIIRFKGMLNTLKTCFLHLWIKVINYFKAYLKRSTYQKNN